MIIRIELTETEIQEAVKAFVLKKLPVQSLGEVFFIYDEEEEDEHTPITGAIVDVEFSTESVTL